MRNLSFYLLITIVSVACGSKSNSTDAQDAMVQSGWETYDMNGYSISAPDDWNLDTSGRNNTAFILFAPFDSVNSMFRENINMVVEDLTTTEQSLEEYVDYAHGILEEHMDGFKNFRVANEAEDRIWLNYEGEQRTIQLYFQQLLAMKDRKVHIVTFTSMSDTTQNYIMADKVISSFEFSE